MKGPFLALMNDSKSSSQIFVNVKKTLIYSIHIRDRLDGTVSEVTNPTSSQIVLHEQIGTFISNSIRKRIDLLTDKIYLIGNGIYENIGFSSPFVKDLR